MCRRQAVIWVGWRSPCVLCYTELWFRARQSRRTAAWLDNCINECVVPEEWQEILNGQITPDQPQRQTTPTCEMSNGRMKEPRGFTKVAGTLYNLSAEKRHQKSAHTFRLCPTINAWPLSLSQEHSSDIWTQTTDLAVLFPKRLWHKLDWKMSFNQSWRGSEVLCQVNS